MHEKQKSPGKLHQGWSQPENVRTSLNYQEYEIAVIPWFSPI